MSPSTSSGIGGGVSAGSGPSTGSVPSTGSGHGNRQAIAYCPYCAEETLFPLEGGGWECRSCLRAFSVAFLGLVTPGPRLEQESS